MGVFKRLAENNRSARNATAKFVTNSEGTDKALRDFFAALPEHYRKKAITNIYIRVLRRVQADIRANIRSNFKVQSGRLEKSINVKYLKPNKGSSDPAAMVYVSNSKKYNDVYNIRTRKIVKGVSARYAYALEYGTPERKRKSKGGGSTGSIKPKPYFRPAIDKWQPQAESEVMNELSRSGMRELDRHIRTLNNKTIKITV